MSTKKFLLPIEKSHRIISPRIAYIITSIDKDGHVNAAPFSNLTSVSTDPERLVLAVYKEWDTIRNIRQTKEFVVNVPSKELLQEVWICGDKYAGHPIPRGVNELKIAKLTEISSEKVKPPRIKECYAHLECKTTWIKNVGDHYLILADIVSASFTEGYFDKDFVLNVSKSTPLMEISRNLFTYPENIIKSNREYAREKVKNELTNLRIKIPKKIRIYEDLKFSEE
jgi:flavin reductase (DIM6/NTAB) family NADH-FMN oxidoreductase RutF